MTTTIPVVGGREAIVTAFATESGYRNALGFAVRDPSGAAGPDTLVFADDDAVAPGTRFNLGAFPGGSELEFFLLQDGGARLSGEEQARVTALPGGGFAVGFEDLLADPARNPLGYARDDDFDDLVFAVGFGPATARFLFTADDGVVGREPWVTDATAEGTRLLLDINPGRAGSLGSTEGAAGIGAGRVVFAADDGTAGSEPWITDGTADGTRLLRDINPGAADGVSSGFAALGNGRALFRADDGANGQELWVTDGTEAGTRLARDIDPGPEGGLASVFVAFAALGDGRALFAARDGAAGEELWVSDGTEAGTALVRDINPGPGSGFPFGFTALGDGRALFRADDGANGTELWVSDGAAAGTALVRDINPGGAGSMDFDAEFGPLGGGRALFGANNGAAGQELWITDGTGTGTRLLRDINPGPNDGSPRGFAALGDGRLLFNAFDPATGNEPWISDGTEAGTRPLRDLNPGPSSSIPLGFAALGDGRALFEADDGASGVEEPFITDGTEAGTRLVRDLNPGPNGSFPDDFTALGDGRALFGALDGSGPTALWVTDGTAAGTIPLREFAFFGLPSGITPLGTGDPSGTDPFT